jgi:hypothetical protein
MKLCKVKSQNWFLLAGSLRKTVGSLLILLRNSAFILREPQSLCCPELEEGTNGGAVEIIGDSSVHAEPVEAFLGSSAESLFWQDLF